MPFTTAILWFKKIYVNKKIPVCNGKLPNSMEKTNENTNLMQHCAGFVSAGSLYMFQAQAPIIRSI
jgi:hypothetical protein